MEDEPNIEEDAPSRIPLEEVEIDPEVDYEAVLEQDRELNDTRLKSRFEQIFEKYGKDFTNIGDEIDLETGAIVVDNGHLERMRHEADPGNSESSQFVQAFAENMEHEGESAESDEDATMGESDEGETEDSAAEGLDPNIDPRLHNTTSAAQDANAQQTGYGSTRQSEEMESRSSTPFDMDEHMPDLHNILQAQPKAGTDFDASAIQELGQSIAKQLAEIMNAKSKAKEKPKRIGAWDYPELPKDKRPRLQSPPRPRPLIPSLASVEKAKEPQESLWAPVQHPKPIKWKKKKAPEESATEQEGGERAGGEDPTKVGAELHRCDNCATSATPSWHIRQDGMRLCSSCSHYQYRWGLMKPVPSAVVEEVAEKEVAEDMIHYSANTSRPLNDGRSSHSSFGTQEDSLIIKLKEIDGLSWGQIRNYFPGRTQFALQCRYSKMLFKAPCEGRKALIDQGYICKEDIMEERLGGFTPTEDEFLVQLREEGQLDWDFIADRMPDQTAKSVEARYELLISSHSLEADAKAAKFSRRRYKGDGRPELSFQKFTPDEDALLNELRETQNLSWEEISHQLPTRTESALQKRYTRQLVQRKSKYEQEHGKGTWERRIIRDRLHSQYTSKYTRFTEEEDRQIAQLHEKEGLDWPEIAEKMSGRSEKSIKNRYLYKLKGTTSAPRPNDASNVDGGPAQKDSATEGGGTPVEPPTSGNLTAAEEDDLILKLRNEGQDWDKIRGHMPYKSVSSIMIRHIQLMRSRHPEVLEAAARAKDRNHFMVEGTPDSIDPQLSGGDVEVGLSEMGRPPKKSRLSMPRRTSDGPATSQAVQRHLPAQEGEQTTEQLAEQATEEFIAAQSKGEKFTEEEDGLILMMHVQQGIPLEEVVKFLPGRTVSALYGRWWRKLKDKPSTTYRTKKAKAKEAAEQAAKEAEEALKNQALATPQLQENSVHYQMPSAVPTMNLFHSLLGGPSTEDATHGSPADGTYDMMAGGGTPVSFSPFSRPGNALSGPRSSPTFVQMTSTVTRSPRTTFTEQPSRPANAIEQPPLQPQTPARPQTPTKNGLDAVGSVDAPWTPDFEIFKAYLTPVQYNAQYQPRLFTPAGQPQIPVFGQAVPPPPAEPANIPNLDGAFEWSAPREISNIPQPKQLQRKRKTPPTARISSKAAQVIELLDDEGTAASADAPIFSTPALEKPAFTWTDLIAMALQSAPDNCLLTRDICKSIEDNFPYYRKADKRWKDEVHTCLNKSSLFKRTSSDFSAKWGFVDRMDSVQQQSAAPKVAEEFNERNEFEFNRDETVSPPPPASWKSTIQDSQETNCSISSPAVQLKAAASRDETVSPPPAGGRSLPSGRLSARTRDSTVEIDDLPRLTYSHLSSDIYREPESTPIKPTTELPNPGVHKSHMIAPSHEVIDITSSSPFPKMKNFATTYSKAKTPKSSSSALPTASLSASSSKKQTISETPKTTASLGSTKDSVSSFNQKVPKFGLSIDQKGNASVSSASNAPKPFLQMGVKGNATTSVFEKENAATTKTPKSTASQASKSNGRPSSLKKQTSAKTPKSAGPLAPKGAKKVTKTPKSNASSTARSSASASSSKPKNSASRVSGAGFTPLSRSNSVVCLPGSHKRVLQQTPMRQSFGVGDDDEESADELA